MSSKLAAQDRKDIPGPPLLPDHNPSLQQAGTNTLATIQANEYFMIEDPPFSVKPSNIVPL